MSAQFQGTVNAAGRWVPATVNGRACPPFAGIGARMPSGRKAAPPIRSAAQYPAQGDKRVPGLTEALRQAGLRDGMTISSHHHFRDGDLLMQQVFEAADRLGVRELVWAPTASFPCHATLLPMIERGVIHRVEGSLNGPLGEFASRGGMPGPAVLRSHGGRHRAIQDGDLHIDIAIIAAPAADAFGNCSGVFGPSACGPLGFAHADAHYADHVIVVTDNLVPFPCAPWSVPGNHVDQVVECDKIGDAGRIVSGTTRLTRSPDRLLIAHLAAQFVRDSGLMREGFGFQAGAGGISLAFNVYLRDFMRAAGVRAGFARGGGNRYLVEMLEQGDIGFLLDGQSFDLEAVRSLRENPRHVETNPFISYNYHGKGNIAGMVDVAVLGATEVDVDFNANVVTHSDGLMLHGIGGWQDALHAKCSILTVPTFRDRMPVVRDRVTTLCAPGEMVDVIVTERGIAINPLRRDLLERALHAGLPVRDIRDLKAAADDLCGGPPATPEPGDAVVGVVEWVDGTLLDCVRRATNIVGDPDQTRNLIIE